MSASIFISFASQDQKVAMTLCSALESRGFRCWISARDILPGENFQISIVRAIRQAKIMLLVFTANSNKSEEMNKELALASQSKLIVVPLRVQDVAPNDAFAYEFATRQWIDFFADWESAINQLAGRIGAALNDHTATSSAPAEATQPVAVEPAAAIAQPPPPAEAPPAARRRSAPPPPPPAPEAQMARPADDAPPAAEPDLGEAVAARRPAKLYLGLSLAAVVAVVVAGLVAQGLHRSPQASAHAGLSIQKSSPAASALQTTSVAAPAVAAADAAAPLALSLDKPTPVKKKKASGARKADDYVPY